MVTTKRKAASSSSSPPGETIPADDGEQLLNKDGTRRKSRVLRRKTDHSIIERRRREKINEKLVALQNIVPACRKECQDLIDRKFVTPLRDVKDNDALNSVANKKTAKRKREEEKLEKAKEEMTEKVRTSMVLEKLCIISHTLEFVLKLQEENRALRALCDCQAERRASITSEVELDEHYRYAHSSEVQQESKHQDLLHAALINGHTKRPSLSSTSSSDEETLSREAIQRPAKRRLHWGSDDVREAAIRSDVCRHRCHTGVDHDACRREISLSPIDAQTSCVGNEEPKAVSTCQHDVFHASSTDPTTCHSICRTRHSCCREDEQSSEASSDASDSIISPPPYSQRWPAVNSAGQAGYLGRPRLPPILNLGLPKQDSHLSSFRHDKIASLYRRDVARTADVPASRIFRPLSLYTSHAPPAALSSAKP